MKTEMRVAAPSNSDGTARKTQYGSASPLAGVSDPYEPNSSSADSRTIKASDNPAVNPSN
jgi:hypothetical protein